jgi:choline kinase
MKLIILAGGEGQRLRPMTENKPKCMVEVYGKTMIDHILDAVATADFSAISVVSGYKSDILQQHLKGRDITFFFNDRFSTTNMVETLFCASPFADGDDVIISYSDIIYNPSIIQKLCSAGGDLQIVVDTQWQKLWQMRMEDPLKDAETMKIENGKIVELGKKPEKMEDIQGQYIGLIRMSGETFKKAETLYKSALEQSPTAAKMYMTDLLQNLIDTGSPATPVFIGGGWLEVDTVDDLNVYTADEELKKSITGY